MLKRANETDVSDILDFCTNSIIGTKIACLCLCYGFERAFFELWHISDENGKLSAVIAKFYDNVTILCVDYSYIEDIKAFLNMSCYNSLMCSEEFCQAVGFKNAEIKNGYVFDSGYDMIFKASFTDEADYKKAYCLISDEISGSFKKDEEAYLSFLSDFMFRKMRDSARWVNIKQDGEISAVALTSSETDTEAVISGVACRKNARKKGLGKDIVLSLVSILKNENKKPYVIALNESAEGFYEHIGFKKKERIAFVERKNDV